MGRTSGCTEKERKRERSVGAGGSAGREGERRVVSTKNTPRTLESSVRTKLPIQPPLSVTHPVCTLTAFHHLLLVYSPS